MQLKSLSPILGLLVASSFVTAQDEPKKPQDPVPQEAAAKVEPGIPLAFTVTGLTKENVAKVKESLQMLVRHIYACEKCKSEQAEAGKCCNAELVAKKQALFKSVAPSAEDSTVKLTLDPAAGVHLTELEMALQKNAVKIDPAKFPIAGKANLVFRGAGADAVPSIEKALKDAKLFDNVKATFDAEAKEIHVTVSSGATPPTRAKLDSTLAGAGVKTQLADVIWGDMMKKAG